MTEIRPLTTLLDVSYGQSVLQQPELERLYGPLQFELREGRPRVIANFVESLDGVVALDDPSVSDGSTISGHSKHDRLVMGVLRAVSDAVVVGAGTLRADKRHVWTADHVFPSLSAEFQAQREALGLPPQPLNVFATSSGNIDLNLRVFTQASVPALIVTSTTGAGRLGRQKVPPHVSIVDAGSEATISAATIIAAVSRVVAARIILLEGGPHLMSDFISEHKLDELFLTLSPQVAGRDKTAHRPGFAHGALFSPHNEVWSELISVKRSGSHLFLRYCFTEGLRYALALDQLH